MGLNWSEIVMKDLVLSGDFTMVSDVACGIQIASFFYSGLVLQPKI